MALRQHVFFVSDDETVCRLPAVRYDRLRRDPSARLVEYANQRVRVVEVVVECIDRTPMRLQIHSTFFLSFDATGALDHEQLLRGTRGYVEVAMAPPTDTAARFLRRRLDHQHRWEVTPRIFAHIADVVFGDAGWTPPPRGGRVGARSISTRPRRRAGRR